MANESYRKVLKSLDELKPFFWHRMLPEEKYFEVRLSALCLEKVVKDGKCVCNKVGKTIHSQPWYRISRGILGEMQVDLVQISLNTYKIVEIINQGHLLYREPNECQKYGVKTVEIENNDREEK